MNKYSSLITARNENQIDAGATGEAFKVANKTQSDVLCHGFILKYNGANRSDLMDIDCSFWGGKFDPIIDSAELSTFGPPRDSDRGAKEFLFRGGPVEWPKGTEFSIKIKPAANIAAGAVEISFIIEG